MEPSRNYNINRPLDSSTEKFEKELETLLTKYHGTHIEYETFGEDKKFTFSIAVKADSKQEAISKFIGENIQPEDMEIEEDE